MMGRDEVVTIRIPADTADLLKKIGRGDSVSVRDREIVRSILTGQLYGALPADR